MGLTQKISDDIKAAMRAQEKERMNVLRMLLSELKYAKTALPQNQELSLEEETKAIDRYAKKLEKSIKEFPAGEQQEKIRAEIKIIEEYLPKKAGEAEVKEKIAAFLQTATTREFGLLMKELKTQFGSSADGALLARLLKEELAKS